MNDASLSQLLSTFAEKPDAVRDGFLLIQILELKADIYAFQGQLIEVQAKAGNTSFALVESKTRERAEKIQDALVEESVQRLQELTQLWQRRPSSN